MAAQPPVASITLARARAHWHRRSELALRRFAAPSDHERSVAVWGPQLPAAIATAKSVAKRVAPVRALG